MHYCPGCGHTMAHKLVCDVIDGLGVRERTIGIAPVGCAVLAYDYWNFDVTEAPHGRCPAVATAIKRLLPDRVVFTYQGDGDLAAIGTSEIIHTANRGENITTVFVNNGVYGMTGGQLAPTTMLGQKTATTIKGRDVRRDGYPLKIAELIALLPGTRYVERVSIHTKAGVERAAEALRTAFKVQMDGRGFSLVEIVAVCPTYGARSVKEAYDRVENEIIKFYPLGILKDEGL
ncbi:MAG: thiamine pyrophosphate-dependent enzyme [Candidatus Omnitrophica bacterium]|nr:thiamine pyrophosphate-dependent enzyme [Candidatus Omnitrophota bacterium]